MTEAQRPGEDPGTDQGSHASVGNDVEQAGGGRTESETAVDEALGEGDPAAG